MAVLPTLDSFMLDMLVTLVIFYFSGHLLSVQGCTTGVVRLVGGSYSYEGRVEVCSNNTWGTVCDDSFGSSDARVVCRQLGYSSATTFYDNAYFGAGSGPIWLDDLGCSGYEFTIIQCYNRGLGSNDCSHSEDVGVSCSGTKTGICTNGNVRLVGGPNSTSGRVEVCANNYWGTVCDDYWDNSDATVVCKMLGFHTVWAIATTNAFFGEGSGSILLDNVQCTGNEASIFSCTHNAIGSNDCSHSEDAGVVCTSLAGCTYGELRLVGGHSSTEGRVEICISNVWGTICDDYWDDDDAKVVCRQLGYSTGGAKSYHGAYFGQGSGSIFLDDVICLGSESSLLQCYHSPIGYHDCTHSEDASVSCLILSPGAIAGITISGLIIIISIAVCIIICAVVIIKKRRAKTQSRRQHQGIADTAPSRVVPPAPTQLTTYNPPPPYSASVPAPPNNMPPPQMTTNQPMAAVGTPPQMTTNQPMAAVGTPLQMTTNQPMAAVGTPPQMTTNQPMAAVGTPLQMTTNQPMAAVGTTGAQGGVPVVFHPGNQAVSYVPSGQPMYYYYPYVPQYIPLTEPTMTQSVVAQSVPQQSQTIAPTDRELPQVQSIVNEDEAPIVPPSSSIEEEAKESEGDDEDDDAPLLTS